MNNDKSGIASGLSIPGALQLIFITLRLMKIIDWPWFWIFSPFVFTIALIFIIAIGIIIIGAAIRANDQINKDGK